MSSVKKDTLGIFENWKLTYVLPSCCLLKHFLSSLCQGTSGAQIRLHTYNNIPVMIKVPVESFNNVESILYPNIPGNILEW